MLYVKKFYLADCFSKNQSAFFMSFLHSHSLKGVAIKFFGKGGSGRCQNAKLCKRSIAS